MTAPTPPTSALVRPFTVSISDSEIDWRGAGEIVPRETGTVP